ncbi:CopD family protein [Niabella sp. 22666]|uniref:CopD family protein n=1 Tax=Niabella sp. 22666 TaxID=3453954 RepID=UPI003F859743
MSNAYLYIKATHIIFVVTWFAGLFYMPRLLIYNVEANDKEPLVKQALQAQFAIMMKRLWYGITWPSAILTLILGLSVLFKGPWTAIIFHKEGLWLLLKLILVVFLYSYHLYTHRIFKQQLKGIFTLNSQQLRMWNEAATLLLISIVMLVVVKQGISLVWGLVGTVLLVVILLLAIRIYKRLRNKS